MHLDVRLPIGLLFTAFGLLLVGYGLTSDSRIYQEHSLGININLVWGLVVLGFGGIMLLIALRSRNRNL